MKPDRIAFAVGVLALMLAGLGFWTTYGQVDLRLAGMLAPAALIVIGAGMLLLSRRHN